MLKSPGESALALSPVKKKPTSLKRGVSFGSELLDRSRPKATIDAKIKRRTVSFGEPSKENASKPKKTLSFKISEPSDSVIMKRKTSKLGAATTSREKRLGLDAAPRKLRSRGSFSHADAGEFMAFRRYRSKSTYVDLIQNKPKESYPNEESDLSARGLSSRTLDRFKNYVKTCSTALTREKKGQTTAKKYELTVRRGYANLRLGRFEDAKRDIADCLRTNPRDAALYYNRSVISGMRKDIDDGIKDLTRAIELEPKSKYLENRALYYRQAGRFKDAIKDYKRLQHKKLLQAKRGRIPLLGKRRDTKNGSVHVRIDGRDRLVSKAKLKNIVFNIKPMYRTEVHVDCMVSVLRHMKAFHGIPEELLRKLCKMAKYERYRKGEYVFRQGDRGSEMYVLLSGSASVRIAQDPETERPLLANQRKGAIMVREVDLASKIRDTALRKSQGIDDSKIVGMIKPGDRFGEMAKLESAGDGAPTSQRRRLASIVVEENSEMVHFNQTPTKEEMSSGRQEEALERVKTLEEYRNWEVESRKASLRRCVLFELVDDVVMHDLAQLAVLQTFQTGQTLQKQGEIIKTFYILRSGLCKVSKAVNVSELEVEACIPGQNKVMSPFLRSRFGLSNVSEENILTDFSSPLCTHFDVGVITGGQVAGEPMLFDMRHQVRSPITVKAQTRVEALAIDRSLLKRVYHHFLGQSLQRLRASFLLVNPPRERLVQHMKVSRAWNKRKTDIIIASVNPTNPAVAVAAPQPRPATAGCLSKCRGGNRGVSGNRGNIFKKHFSV